MLCMYGSRCFSQDDPRWSDMTILYAMWYDAMALSYKFFVLSFFCLKALFLLFFLWPLLHNAQTKIAIVYMREQTCDTRYDTNICTTDDMVCMLWEVWSLMCTSHVAGNTQMASLDRQVTQNGLGVNNAIAREYTKVSSRLPSFAMMRGGVLGVDTKMMATRP